MPGPRARKSRVSAQSAGLGLLLILALGGCAKKDSSSLLEPPPTPSAPLFRTLSFGTQSNLEVVTWNVRDFPISLQATPPTTESIRYLVSAVRAIDADIVCIQEIKDHDSFLTVIDSLNEYEGFAATSDNYINLGILYKSSTVTDVSFEELFTSRWRPFPRAPLKMTATFGGTRYVVINNHFKCCDRDGTEVARRSEASRLLDEYIATTLPHANVILLGDLNDRLTDPRRNNVFQVFFDQPAEYRFADFELASGPPSEFSWIGSNSPSHLDHILVTNELFAALDRNNALVVTLKPEVDLIGGLNEYRKQLSDHRPVAMRIAP